MSRVGSASLDRVAGVGTVLLRRCQGSIASVVATVGPSRLAPHICPDTFRHCFVTIKRFPAINQLLRVLSPGLPVCVARGGDLPTKLDYGNHPSALPHAVASLEKVCADVSFEHALVFDLDSAAKIRGLGTKPWLSFWNPNFVSFMISPLRARAYGPALITTHMFCPLRHGSSATSITIWSCGCYSCVSHTVRMARLVLCRVDVKDGFRQAPVDPAGAPVFGYVAGGHAIVDLRLRFGWRNSPGFHVLVWRSNILTLIPRSKLL